MKVAPLTTRAGLPPLTGSRRCRRDGVGHEGVGCRRQLDPWGHLRVGPHRYAQVQRLGEAQRTEGCEAPELNRENPVRDAHGIAEAGVILGPEGAPSRWEAVEIENEWLGSVVDRIVAVVQSFPWKLIMEGIWARAAGAPTAGPRAADPQWQRSFRRHISTSIMA